MWTGTEVDRRATACERRVEDGVADAIIALHFHDIASQLVTQIAARVHTVDGLTPRPAGIQGRTVARRGPGR